MQPAGLLLGFVLLTGFPSFADPARLELREGERICLVGGATAERLQHDGWLEARLRALFPELAPSLRNLGFSGDELTVAQRTAGFGDQDEWLDRCDATLIVGFYGYNESFAGTAELPRFRADLAAWIGHVREQAFGERPPRVVLVTPAPHEPAFDHLLLDAEARGATLRAYRDAVLAVAREHGVPTVDLFAPLGEAFARAEAPLTINGAHLTTAGTDVLAQVITAALFPERSCDPDEVERLRPKVLEKNLLWFNRYRATDGYNVYGGRSALKYEDDVSNYEVLQREMHVLDAMCANLDGILDAMARKSPGAAFVPVPERIPVRTNRPGEGPDGAHLFRDGVAAIEHMTPAPGMKVTLFADEERFPELANPVQMSFDAAGNLWVACWPTYPHWAPGEEMNDKLVVCHDDDGDGVADRTTIFADDLHNPTGFEHWNGGVLVANCPDLLFLEDTDGDGRADRRERLLHGLSSADTHHAANSFVIGPEGALYFQEGTFHRSQVETIHGPVRNDGGCVWRFDPRTWRVERYVPYGFANPHGHVFDRWGQDFVTDGTGNVNYYALPFSGHLDFPARHRGYFPFFRQRSRPSAATEILSSAHFPAENQGNYLIANVIGFQGIFQYRIEDDGSGFRADEVDPLVFSTDPNFRPVDIEVGPDGAVWFVDWHNPLIGHMQHHLRDPSRDRSHGRVYRVTAEGAPLNERVRLEERGEEQLVASLADPSNRVRYRARAELLRRPTDAVVGALDRWVDAAGEDEHERRALEALWVRSQHGLLSDADVGGVLGAEDPRVRAAGTRALRHARYEFEDPLALLAPRIDDPHPRVRLEALVALSFLQEPRAAELALRVLSHDTDRFLDYALEETLRALEPSWREPLVAGASFAEDDPVGLAHVLSRLTTDELPGVRPSRALDLEVLARHGLDAARYEASLRRLAGSEGSVVVELVAAIVRADARSDGHADHLLIGLFEVLGTLAPDGATSHLLETLPRQDAVALLARMRELSHAGRRAATRSLATAAWIELEGSVEPCWREASRRQGGVQDVLAAAPYVDEPALAEELFERALPLLALSGEAQLGTRGRFVRIELVGAERTLTLAEVEVFSGDRNVAPAGSASQSTVNWGGHAERAIDGNQSGRFGDGGQSHTLEDQPDPWWELDLGASVPIERIVVWNRSDGDGGLAARLDGFVVRVLDRERRTVFRHQAGAAPRETVLDLADPGLRLRRAAARALGALGVRQDEAVRELVPRFAEPELRVAVTEALRSIAFERWPPGADETLATALTDLLRSSTTEGFEHDDGRALLAFAQELAAHLGNERGASLADLARRRGPRAVVIRPVRDALAYDRTSFDVVAGSRVELLFDNTDIMPHNLVVAAIGALSRVGRAGEAMAQDPDAWARGFVPELDEVLFATGLLQPGERETLAFTAPAQPGDYPYVCTFPGHWVRMNGTMRVVSSWEELELEEPSAAAVDDGPAFVASWTPEDFAGALDELPQRSPEPGRAVFEAASCSRCHPIEGQGGRTGPDLAEVVPRYGPDELLLQILEPSRVIAEEYATEIFETSDGLIAAGILKGEDEDFWLLQDDPYRDDLLEVAKAEVVDRVRSEISTMPVGLLSTFEREQVLDLLAYLVSLAPDD